MKIAIDGRCLHDYKKHGIARYLENLLKYLPQRVNDEIIVFYLMDQFTPWSQKNLNWYPVAIPQLSFKEQIAIPKLLKKLKIDLFHTPSYVIPFSLPCPFIMTIHDLIHIKFPEDYSFFHKIYYHFWVKRMASKAEHILTVSHYSKQELKKWLSNSPPISVVYLGVEERFKPLDLWITTLKNYAVEMPYMLYIGNEKPHKNFSLIFDAFNLFIEHHGPICHLVAIGIPEKFQKQHRQIKYLEFIPDADLPAFYAGARMLINPSLEEGFGLPVIESMACGSPVIISDIPVFQEIVEEAGTFISPYSQMALVEAISLLLSNRELIRYQKLKGIERAKTFNWAKTAQQTFDIYTACLKHEES